MNVRRLAVWGLVSLAGCSRQEPNSFKEKSGNPAGEIPPREEPLAPAAPAKPSQVPAAALVEQEELLTTPFAGGLGNGWRDLRFGMTEGQVKVIIAKYQSFNREWERSQSTTLPIVSLSGKFVSQTSVDETRFHHWYAWDLDEGVKFPHAYFDHGKLVVFRLQSKIGIAEFISKAVEAYGAQPKYIEFRHYDGTRTANRKMAMWRGGGATVLVWDDDGTPNFLVWSNEPMDQQAYAYQSKLNKLENANKSIEKATSF